MPNSQNSSPLTNPFAYSEDSGGIELRSATEFIAIFDCSRLLGSSIPWMIASLMLFLGSTTIWISITMAAVVQNVRLDEWNSEVAIVGSVGVLVFLSLMWPAYWVYRSRIRIHHAVDEPTLASIADVLEAQRSFWRALGILVLLAIAAIVVAATYLAWSTWFG